ncbi:protein CHLORORESPIRATORY REDUCTION 42, chloroplastic [Cornus florida]|uniref:protein CHLORORESPIRATORY REDUCTION 42, chloroplastic n=1 Tax=Cornus florida TaxID=4283 RepID=UPI0028A17AB6|nr:protein CHLORORESPIRATORY REDUCTION 42, chloroplastic [Cornus florida]
MALSLSSSAPTLPCLTPRNSPSLILQFKHYSNPNIRAHNIRLTTKCEFKESSSAAADGSNGNGLSTKGSKLLQIGSPIIVIEAPKMLKTAASVPCLRVNSGLVKPGDVGRIVSRKPKDVWAVRLTIGTYLIDGKYFKPLEVDE